MALLLKPDPQTVKEIFDVSVEPNEQFALKMDKLDPLKRFRSEFEIPASMDGNRLQSIYLCGNSLGCLPKRAAQFVSDELQQWKQYGVEAHFRGKRPWATIDEACVTLIKPLIGAKHESEVAIMNSLSVNNNLLFISFYRPTKTRYKILIEGMAFCSDHHTVRSHLHLHDIAESKGLIEVHPRRDEHCIRTQDIVDAIEAHGNSIAVVWLGAVQYYTGQLFDIARITAVAHRYNIYVGFDLAHGVGNVPLSLHACHVDFASWCSYKYLNSGPGAISGVFVHQRHHQNTALKRLCGWWGQSLEDRFQMRHVQTPKLGAQAWQISNPPVLPTVCLQASLEIFNEAGIENLRYKSVLLTAYLECLLKEYLSEYVEIITPLEREQRGCQLSLVFNRNIAEVHKQITRQGVICDLRKGTVMRVAPTPLYNTFTEVWQFVQILKTCLERGNTSKL
eukprot:CAMPEP_0202689940 /NCGR_PEP_ID=MMETSP1385-20130828/5108_1 /ASSEMBLY_ACC=CAM_ASM_000861 /TAXON_ID=933848 /ORGANISM="Elphidium margaritaceum" /LENGTH=448 /DNA_ID=CAMNT_0049345159 /DNA_START=9 /DNA_END=1355 /DNA_ORIENTATION=-